MKDAHFVHHAYEPPEVAGVKCPKIEDQTQQHFLIDSDINHIMKKFAETGIVGDPLRPATRVAQFGDFSAVPSFREQQDRIIEAEAAFMSLPKSIRDRCGNNMSNLLELVDNPNFVEEGIKIGIFERKKPAEKPDLALDENGDLPPKKSNQQSITKPRERGRFIKKTTTEYEQLEDPNLII